MTCQNPELKAGELTFVMDDKKMPHALECLACLCSALLPVTTIAGQKQSALRSRSSLLKLHAFIQELRGAMSSP